VPAPERTSLVEVVAAGCDLLEEGGPAALTMQAVAARVGVRAPSLYKKVRDRDELLALVAARAAEDAGGHLAATDGTLAGLARAYRAFGHERPEAFRLLLSARPDPETPRRVAGPVLRAAEELVGPDQALEAARFVTAWVTGFVSMELAGAFRLGGDLEDAWAYGLERIQRALTAPA
jgi:AcrR family transcriptional regulator